MLCFTIFYRRFLLSNVLPNPNLFVIKVLGSFRKQGIVFSFFALEYDVGKINNLSFNAVKFLNFVAIFVFFVTAASFI